MPKDTLSVTDNRTGKSYELPIENGCVRSMDLRKIKANAEDFGLMAYDPAFLNTAAARLGWSGRSIHRCLKVARTIADLAGAATVQVTHVAEAVQYRRALKAAH